MAHDERSPRVPFDFLVRRDDLHTYELRDAPAPEDFALRDGEVLLTVDAFGFTANNVTYAVFGDVMGYWSFFPASEGWGRVPVWGFATVARSEHPEVAEGRRVYGYLPMSSYFVVQAGDVTAAGFTDTAEHRRERDPFYNRYLDVAHDPGYDPAREAEQMVFRPLFFTGFLIDDFLEEEGFFGASAVVVGSASSKTAIALASQLHRRGRERCEVVGLTSARNRAFVEGLGCYYRVVTYDEIDGLDAARPTVFVDMAGDADVSERVHRRLGDQLKYSCAVGATHWTRADMGRELPGPAPVLFWAPGRVAKRFADWGADGFMERAGAAWAAFLPRVDGWLEIERGSGRAAIERVYRDTLDGRADPKKGHVLAPGTAA